MKHTMDSISLIIFFSLLFYTSAVSNAFDHSFNQFYNPLWGFDHLKLLQQGDDEVQLMLDKSSGAGFRSKLEYLSGRFHISMKLPEQKSRGVIPNFYLISENTPNPHCELDFEFMGTTPELRTNVYANDTGGRERGFQLWFDPLDDFHSYTILWNSHQIVFLVDDIPITAYKSIAAIGARYPTCPMHIEATVWNADWAGGPVNWSLSPFTIYYRNFTVTGCPANLGAGNCDSAKFEWNAETHWDLNPAQKEQLEFVEQKHMIYSYCSKENASMIHPECTKLD